MERPRVVTTFGILSLAFGGLGLLSIPITLASLYWLEALTHVRNPLLNVMDADPLVRSWTFASLALGTAAAVCLATAGAGLLAMKAWARRLAVLWAGFSLAFGVLGILMNIAVVSPALLRAAALSPRRRARRRAAPSRGRSEARSGISACSIPRSSSISSRDPRCARPSRARRAGVREGPWLRDADRIQDLAGPRVGWRTAEVR